MGRSVHMRNRGESTSDALGVALSTVLCAVLGFVLGFVTWVLLNIAYKLTDVVWAPFTSGNLPWLLVPAVCVAVGALIGWWNKRFHSAPEPFAKVIATSLSEGSYAIEKPAHSFVSFLLPLAFGGPVGPEAGLTGFIAAGCTNIGAAMHAARQRARGVASALSRQQKYVVYGAGVVGGVLGVVTYCALFGGMGLPRFTVPSLSLQSLVWLVPLTIAGLALSGLMRLGMSAFGKLSARFQQREIARAAACGLALGAAALALPYVLFPGTEQLAELIEVAGSVGTVELVATSVVKMLLLTLCLSMGWSGGPFFPLIFCASSLALAISLGAGVNAGLCLIVVTAALLGRFTRKPALALGILLLCVPVRGLLWAAIPLLTGVYLPTIEELAAGRVRVQ